MATILLNDLLNVGDKSANGQVEIIDKDRLCYLVKSISRGAIGIRTINKQLLGEFIDYLNLHPSHGSMQARYALSGKSEIDKYEYGYNATLYVMAQMVLDKLRTLRK